VPEHQQRDASPHERYEELCALAAGGLLEGEEFADFQGHLRECVECRSDYQELSELVTRELPQAQGTFQQKLAAMRAKPLDESRQRFLRRVRAEGLAFSREVETYSPSTPWFFRPVTMLAPVAALVVAAVGLTLYLFRETPNTARSDVKATMQIAELKRQNATLSANLSQLNESLTTEQREIQNLRTELGNATATADALRRDSEQSRGQAERSSSQAARLLDESRDREKLLAEARGEAARSSQLRNNDVASLVEQQTRITELSDKLRIASATLDMERQLAATGKDVRDNDRNGKPRKAFGRVFLAEGKSLTFYAFDLNEDGLFNAKRGFQVWAVSETAKNSARSLGLLRVDAKAPGRWVLRVENPELVKEVSSVFVTIESAAGGKQPSGQKMLYAYLGEANHP
jgi:hypothetical protein